MYIKSAFKPRSTEDVHRVMREHPLAIVLTSHQDMLEASHLPLIFDAERGLHGTLIGHMARMNPQFDLMQKNPAVTVIFNGPDHYISPGWYPKRDSAPTWNYVKVHCHGRVRFASCATETMTALETLTSAMEHGSAAPWSGQTELGSDGLQRRLAHIIGFEIEIKRIEAKFKLSQDERAEDAHAAIQQLQVRGQFALARYVQDFNADRLLPNEVSQ